MRKIFGDLVKKMPIKFKNSYWPENEFQSKLAGKWISAEIGRNWSERPEQAEMGQNLIQGGMEGISIPFYTPVRYIPAVSAEMEWNP